MRNSFVGIVFVIFNVFLIFSVIEAQVFTQSPDCGVVNEIPGEDRTKVPWVVGIFVRTSNKQPFKYHITGTIIGPSTVITVFSGAYGEPIGKTGKYFISPAANYKIAAALKTNDLNDTDEHVQISEVKYIVPFRGPSNNREHHFFIFHLKTPLDFKSPYVNSICVALLSKSFPSETYTIVEHAKNIRQGGFAVPEYSAGYNALQILDIDLLETEYCWKIYREFYVGLPETVYCGRSPNVNINSRGGRVFRCTLHGNAPAVPFNGIWYIVGITSLIPPLTNTTNWCGASTVYFYGRLIKAIDWMVNNINCGPNNFACDDGSCIKLQNLCDQTIHCSRGEDEDPIFCRARKPCIYDGKTFECGTYGKCLRPGQVCDGTRDCNRGLDEKMPYCNNSRIARARRISDRISFSHNRNKVPVKFRTQIEEDDDFDNQCRLTLPMADSEGVQIQCHDPINQQVLPCDKAVAGTIAKFECRDHYRQVYKRTGKSEITCGPDYAWDERNWPFGCELDCGIISSNEISPFILGGRQISRLEAFPWHAAIFFWKHDKYEFTCGASLIENFVVITAAHCVTNENGSPKAKHNFKIALGAISSSYKDNENNPDVQIFNVLNVSFPPTYDNRNLQSDIAIVQLDRPVIFGEFVRPVCYLSQGGQKRLRPGDVGKVSGLGFVSEKNISKYLRYAEFPIVPPMECTKALKTIQPLSSFCAGHRNGTAVCKGDSGGGMVFPERSNTASGTIVRYVLKGIVSHGEFVEGRLCNPNNYAVFTTVDAYADWILSELERSIRK